MGEPKKKDTDSLLWKGGIKWDDLTIEAESLHIPEQYRKDFLWLKKFTRDNADRDVDRLLECFRKVGVFRDRTTWSKILRGLMMRTAKGESKPPVISFENFKCDVEALRTGIRQEALKGKVPFIPTSTTQSIFDYIDERREVTRVNKFGVVIGHTGTQKTATFKEFKLQRDDVWWFEAPENGAVGEFLTCMGICSGLSPQQSGDRKRNHLLKSVRPHHCIIIDNCQDLYRPEWKDRQPSFSFLRRLQDETGCVIILSITPTFRDVLTGQVMAEYFEQFEGRSGGAKTWLTLTEYAPPEDVVAIANGFGLAEAEKHQALLVKISRERGRIRRLFEDLQGAKVLAAGDPLTIEHVTEYRGGVR